MAAANRYWHKVQAAFDTMSPERLCVWKVGAALLLILGAKLALIGTIQNPVPYWDQWFAEGEQLYLPHLQHRLDMNMLVAPHNEHRILLTRLFLLVILEICGNWNTLAAMIAGCLVHVVALASLAYCLRRTIVAAPLLPTAMLISIFAIPFGGENTLWGFQSANYFMILLGIWTVILTTVGAAFDARWWLGYALGLTAIFAMAAAGTALAAAGSLVMLQLIIGARHRNWREIAGTLLLIATGAALLAITPHPPGYLTNRPTSLGGFAWSFGLAGGWPVTLPAIGPLILYAPTFYLMWRLWRRDVASSDHAWRIVAIAAWIGLQAIGTAYSRSTGPIASRYLDTLGIACVANACAIVAIARLELAGLDSRIRLAAMTWVAGIIACLTFHAAYGFPRAYFLDPRIKDAQLANVSSFLITGHFGSSGKLPYSLTYGDLPRLALVLNQMPVRGLLPPELGSTTAERAAAHNQLRLKGGLNISWQRAGQFAFVLGLALLTVGTWLYALPVLLWPGKLLSFNPRADVDEQ